MNTPRGEQRLRLNQKLKRELGDTVVDALGDPDVIEVMLPHHVSTLIATVI